jgi:hypothetical protein
MATETTCIHRGSAGQCVPGVMKVADYGGESGGGGGVELLVELSQIAGSQKGRVASHIPLLPPLAEGLPWDSRTNDLCD